MHVQAWAESPLETLQLVAQLRDIRNGKAERARAHDALIWLSRNHPRTLLANLPEVVKVRLQALVHVLLTVAFTLLKSPYCPRLCIVRSHRAM